jgi:hypothetical protein
MVDLRDDRRLVASGGDHDRLTCAQLLDARRMDDVLVPAPARPAARGAVPQNRRGGVLGRDPGGPGARHGGDQLGRLGHVLAVGDQRLDVAEHLVAQGVVPGGPEIRELLGRQHQAHARRPAAGEQAADLFGADARELVDHDDGWGRFVLQVGGHSDQIADDRAGEHLRQQRAPVGLQREVHDPAPPQLALQVDRALRLVGVQPPGDV